MSEIVLDRNPLCARCRTRHKTHTAIAYMDTFDKAWRCLGCNVLLDSEGECNTEGCCGNPTRLSFAIGRSTARFTRHG